REGLEEHGMNQGENGRRCADAKRDGQDGRDGKGRRHPQSAQRVARVLDQRLHCRHPPLIAVVFLHRFHTSEPERRLAVGLGRGHVTSEFIFPACCSALVEFRLSSWSKLLSTYPSFGAPGKSYRRQPQFPCSPRRCESTLRFVSTKGGAPNGLRR